MSDDILINVTPQETRVAVLQQGIVQELHIERGSHRGMVSNMYVGRVKRVLPGTRCCTATCRSAPCSAQRPP